MLSSLTELAQPWPHIQEREHWTGKLDFVLSLLGFAVGLGNVWRFPYLAYKNGGGAFAIPYFTSLIVLGMPIFLLELSLGQYTSCGPTCCWEFCNLIQGCGFSMCIIAGLTAIYYNVIIAWGLWFFFASFTSDLPWAECGEWSTKFCSDRIRYMTVEQCIWENGTVSKGLCQTTNNVDDDIWMVDREVAKANGINIQFTAMEYFNRRVTGYAFSDINSPGPPRGELVVCLILSWILVAACLSKGIKSSGKVVYVTATLPYLMLAALFVRGLTLEGSGTGILYFVTPRTDFLPRATIWKDAAVQIFFSLSASYGGLIALASYNKFHNDILRDALVVGVGNSLTSIFAGFVIFSYMGFLALDMQLPIDDVTSGGVSLAFGVYPFCLTKLPSSSLWSVVFFFMIILLGIDSEFVLVESVITAIIDTKPQLREQKFLVTVSVCFGLCLIGISMTTDVGIDVLTIMDTYSSGWNVLVIAAIESSTVSWIYGGDKFIEDINVMCGGQICECLPFKPHCAIYWRICWAVFCPCFAVFIIIFSLIDYTRIEHLPHWVDIVGWGLTAVCVGSIIVVGVINLVRAPGTLGERFWYVVRPTKLWGPLMIEHRQLIHNIKPEIVVNPYEVEPIPNPQPETAETAETPEEPAEATASVVEEERTAPETEEKEQA